MNWSHLSWIEMDLELKLRNANAEALLEIRPGGGGSSLTGAPEQQQVDVVF